ncbi:MAG: Ig-like domain-containing protein, partial [Anaerolineales bacterium]
VNDEGMGDDPIRVELETIPDNGTVEVVGNLIRYTPIVGFLGDDSFIYKATDVDSGTSSARVSVSITAASPASAAGIVE